jgi:hypothetical protein
MKQTIELPMRVEVTEEDLVLIEDGLRLLLMTEDDKETIDRIKALLNKVESEIEVRPS